ncbi:MAG TPA: helix-turn-helix domain-containing protein [Pyrinomonadaceae bacterium]|nr:helix-turn-helix domain-containing protein [Pyrinomonadaceae bacterium]
MSQTLGEKLRQAREDEGLTLADVAEQTRISSLYLEAIENDDYKILPGGIFNKGFIKSYAKFVGIDEQEALMDYQANLARTEGIAADSEPKVYRPEVLTDDNAGSMLPTILVAGVVLALMTVGILYLVSYLRSDGSATAANSAKPATTASAEPTPAVASEVPSAGTPDMSTVKVEFKATSADVSLTAVVDGGKGATSLVAAGNSTTFEPKQSLKLSYSRSLANAVALTINGKPIAPPTVPANPKRAVIEFELNRDNLSQIWASGAVTGGPTAADNPPNANVNAVVPTTAPKPTPKPAAANTAANTAVKPPANTAKPPTMMTTTKPSPKPNE